MAIIIAFAIAGLLYYKSKKFDGQKKALKPLLGVIRFLTIFLVGVLIMGPLIKTIQEESKKPKIVLLQDNSLSVGNWLESNNKDDYVESITNVKTELSDQFEVDSYIFSNEIEQDNLDSLSFSAGLTDLSSSLEFIYDMYEGEHLGAVILATDGIYNEGKNPNYLSIPGQIPVFALALGDTSQRKDLILKSVFHNEIAYLNDQVSILINVTAFNSDRESYRLDVEKQTPSGFVNVHTDRLQIDGESYFQAIDLPINLTDIGLNHFRIRLSGLNQEANRTNNQRDIFIDVLDGRQKITVISNAPHPDIAAITQILETNKNYEVSLFYELPSDQLISESDFVIFHNLPSSKNNINRLVGILDDNRTPRMYIVGNQTNIQAFNSIQEQVSIRGQSRSQNEAQARFTQDFNYFSIDKQLKENIERFPPLSTPFGDYSISPSVVTLLQQRIGNIDTDFPLFSFSDQDGIKTAFLMGEGFWKWKLFDFMENENSDVVKEFLNKSIVYTSTKEDRRKFRVSASDNVYLENEEISFRAELYNNSYELVVDPDVFMTLTNTNNQQFDFTFSKDQSSYSLDIGRYPTGSYSFRGYTSFNGESYEARGRFIVQEAQFELYDMEARHSLLVGLTDLTGGEIYNLSNMTDMSEQILSDNRLKPVLYQNTKTTPWIDLKFIFLLLALLLGTEWFLRRYFGSI